MNNFALSCWSLILCSRHNPTPHPFLRELVTPRFWPCQYLRWAQLCTFQRHPYVPFMFSWFSLSRHFCGRVGQIWVRKCQDVAASKYHNPSLLDDAWFYAWFLLDEVRSIWWHLQFTPCAARELLTFFLTINQLPPRVVHSEMPEAPRISALKLCSTNWDLMSAIHRALPTCCGAVLPLRRLLRGSLQKFAWEVPSLFRLSCWNSLFNRGNWW